MKISYLTKLIRSKVVIAGAVSLLFPLTAHAQLKGNSTHMWASNTIEKDVDCRATYKITIRTGDKRGAGTDSNISLKMTGFSNPHGGGSKTVTFKNINKFISGNAFESGDKDTFFICMNGDNAKLRHVKTLEISSDNRLAGSDWLLKSADIIHPDGSKSEFKYNKWLKSGQLKASAKCSKCPTVKQAKALKIYTVKIKTAANSGAGTDSNIKIGLMGTDGHRLVPLNTLSSANLFERGDIDTFTLAVSGIGGLTSASLESDGKHPGADWDVEWVEIKAAGKLYRQDINKTIKKTSVPINFSDRIDLELGEPETIKIKKTKYAFNDAFFGDDSEISWTYKMEFEKTVTNIDIQEDSAGVKVGVNYAPPAVGGLTTSFEAAFNKTGRNELHKTDSATISKTYENTLFAKAGTLRVYKCIWSSNYDVYNVSNHDKGIDTIGFITKQPASNCSDSSYPDKANNMDSETCIAMIDSYDSSTIRSIVKKLNDEGITLAPECKAHL